MLECKNIHTYNQALDRIRRNFYYPSGDASESRKSDQLTQFTFQAHARLDSSANLENLLAVAQESGCALLLIKPRTVQFLGPAGSATQAYGTAVPDSWQTATAAVLDRSSYPSNFASWFETTDRGEAKCITHYQAPFLVQEHAGVYDCVTGDRIKNRREVIQRVWDQGFACQRGRPLMVARQKWSGSRRDLERAEEIFNEFYLRRNRSDSARKLCQVYTSASRHYAWPGTW